MNPYLTYPEPVYDLLRQIAKGELNPKTADQFVTWFNDKTGEAEAPYDPEEEAWGAYCREEGLLLYVPCQMVSESLIPEQHPRPVSLELTDKGIATLKMKDRQPTEVARQTDSLKVEETLGACAELNDIRPAEPMRLLTGWHAITDALELKYADRAKVKSLNSRCAGPITLTGGKGSQPMVGADPPLAWWNALAVRQSELANQREGRKLSAEAQHNYGRGGSAAPEIDGEVKKRRRTKPT